MLKKVLTTALISTIIVLVICCGAALSFIIGCSVIHWLTNNIVFGILGGFIAVLFALFHGTLVHIVIGIVCGILIAVVYEYTGDIKCNILLHVFYNSLSIFLGGIVLP